MLALFSAIVYGTSDYAGGRATRSAPLLTVTMYAQATTVSLSVALLAIAGDPFPPGSDVAWSAAAGLASLTGIVSFYEALSKGEMTVVAPITAVVSAVVPVAVGVATGERPSALAMIGVALALVAVALISGVTGRTARPSSPRILSLALVAGIGFGLLFVFLDRTSDDSGFWPLCIGQLTSFPVVIALIAARRVPIRGIGGAGGLAVAAGALAISANASYLLATREGLLSLVAVIASMYPATTVALATTLDHERLTRPQLVGLGMAVSAVAMVSAGA